MTGGPTPPSPADAFEATFGRGLLVTLLLALAAGLVTAVISLLLPKSYRAEAVILPNVQNSGAASLLGLAASSGIDGLLSGATGLGENPILTYPEILRSRTVLERTLLSPYPPRSDRATGTVMDAIAVRARNPRERLDAGIRQLKGLSTVGANPRSGLITVSVVTRDSVLSSYIAERMLQELDRFNVESRASQGRATREFVEARLVEAKAQLGAAERALAGFREANLRIGNSPQLQLEQARLQREVDTQSELYRLLARQFEIARIEEMRDTPTFSVIEAPTPPVKKYRPKILLNAFVAFCVAILIRLVLELALMVPRGLRLAQSRSAEPERE